MLYYCTTKQQGANMKKELIALATFVALAFGAYKYATEPDFEKKCETYMRGDYNKNTNTCEIIIEQPTEEPEKHLNDKLRKLLGGKADCTLNSSEIPDPRKYPFRQNVFAVCNGMKMNIAFKESLNDYSKALIQRTRDFNSKCGRYIEAAPSKIKVSDEYRYDYFEFGKLQQQNMTGYKELASRNAEQPMVCRAPVHKPIKHPAARNLATYFSNCTVIESEIPDANKPSKQNVAARCNDINVIFEFDNVTNSKQR